MMAVMSEHSNNTTTCLADAFLDFILDLRSADKSAQQILRDRLQTKIGILDEHVRKSMMMPGMSQPILPNDWEAGVSDNGMWTSK